MNVMPAGLGWVEAICGPMFSGKSEELIRRLRRAQIARQPLQAFKPRIDDRYALERIVSHSDVSIDAVPVGDAAELAKLVRPDTQVLGIDEVQFFDAAIVPLVERLAGSGVRVVVAGLDQDYLGRPFDPMPQLCAIAESVTKVLAICARCGAPAGRSQRLDRRAVRDPSAPPSEERVEVGAHDRYEARCRRCHVPRIEPTTGDLFE
jgi:thymidine kinase